MIETTAYRVVCNLVPTSLYCPWQKLLIMTLTDLPFLYPLLLMVMVYFMACNECSQLSLHAGVLLCSCWSVCCKHLHDHLYHVKKQQSTANSAPDSLCHSTMTRTAAHKKLLEPCILIYRLKHNSFACIQCMLNSLLYTLYHKHEASRPDPTYYGSDYQHFLVGLIYPILGFSWQTTLGMKHTSNNTKQGAVLNLFAHAHHGTSVWLHSFGGQCRGHCFVARATFFLPEASG